MKLVFTDKLNHLPQKMLIAFFNLVSEKFPHNEKVAIGLVTQENIDDLNSTTKIIIQTLRAEKKYEVCFQHANDMCCYGLNITEIHDKSLMVNRIKTNLYRI